MIVEPIYQKKLGCVKIGLKFTGANKYKNKTLAFDYGTHGKLYMLNVLQWIPKYVCTFFLFYKLLCISKQPFQAVIYLYIWLPLVINKNKGSVV